MPPTDLITSDLAPVSTASDRAVARWLMTCAIGVALVSACGAMERLDVVAHPQWWSVVHPKLVWGVDLLVVAPFFVLLLGRHIRPDLRLRLMNLPLLAALQSGMGAYSGTYGVAIGVVMIAIAALIAHQLRASPRLGYESATLRIQPPSPSYQQPATR